MDPKAENKFEDVVRISEGGFEYLIYLPDKGTDYIQTHIFNQKIPYERDMLVSMCCHLQEADVVLDIGANVGNHTLYLASVSQAKVLAFEPNRHLADAIRRSVQLNGLEDTVSVSNLGLGKVPGCGHFERDIPENLGMQRLEVGDGGIEIARLDDQNIPSPVKIIKIDVEGMELDVLEGGRNLILRDRPLLYIESATEADYRQISTYLAELGYGYWESFNATPTHCFRPLASISLNEQVERLIQREVFQEYRLHERLRSARRTQNDAVAKSKKLEEHIARLSAELAIKNEQLQENEDALKTKDEIRERITAALQEHRHKIGIANEQFSGVEEPHSQIAEVASNAKPSATLEEALKGLLSDTVAVQENLKQKIALLDLTRVRLKATERKLDHIVNSTSYLLSKKIVEAGTSLSGFLLLPFAIIALAVRGVTRRFGGKKSAQKRPLSRRIKDYAIREVKARPLLERPARKVVLWWRHKGGNISPTEAVLPAYRDRGTHTLVLATENEKVVLFASQIKVATILDEFSFGSFACEFEAIPVEPDNWRERFESEKPDIFFCESAWSGPDPVRRPWKGKVYASVNFKNENRTTLLEIIEYCRINKIPTLFWNKEDPTHFDDRIHDFVKTAQSFDFVFTSCEECVERYKLEYNCKHVFALPFATQPRLFNPIEVTEERIKDIVFAGSWYAQHAERSALMERVLSKFLEDGFSLKIFDRHFGSGDKNHFFPEIFQSYIKPSVRHSEINKIYKSSVYGLNFNTVVDSSTMFARRVYELASSNTLILTNYSKGVDELFGDSVVFVDRQPTRLKELTPADVIAMREKALYTALEKHTYEKRWEYILDCIGYPYRKKDNSLTIVCRISNDEEAEKAVFYANQLDGVLPNTKLLLLVDRLVVDSNIAAFYQKYNRYGHCVIAESYIENYSTEFDGVVNTPNVLYIPKCSFPPSDWVEKAMIHLTYAEKRYICFDQAQQKYRTFNVDPSKPLLCRADGMQSLLGKEPEDEWSLAFCV